MKQSFRENSRPWLKKSSTLYNIAKSIHRTYSSITGNIHTLPNFLIIGAAKAGTSSLYEYLIQHPSISRCVVKEPNYFTTYYDRGINWYKSCFPFSYSANYKEKIQKKKFLTGEATARYYWYPYAPKRAAEIIPNAKIILLLRNPVDRCYSDYNMKFKNEVEKNTFEDAIEVEHKIIDGEWEKMLSDEKYFSFKFTANGYIAKGLYLKYIKNWRKFFSKEQILILKSEDFFKNPEKITNEVFEFLKLSPIKLKKYQIIRKGNYKEMNPETRKKLVEYFKPHNEKLYQYLERDFDWK